MQFSTNISRLALFTLALVGASTAVPFSAMMHWLRTTDANLTYIGAPLNPLAPRDTTTTVTYCTKRVGSVCGGSCSVYNGGPTCIDASGTSCLSATNNVGFCDRAGCGHSCHDLSTCGTHLDNGFCATPGTKSILVSE
ncbi:hypothetical protein V8D89_010222 [Ganoderma adspersum]